MKQFNPSTLALMLAGVAAIALARPALASGLHGSHASMLHQHAIAVGLDYRFVRTPAQVEALVADSALERVTPTEHLRLSNVSYPFARPAVRDFIEWLADEYADATGSPLVVTSLTRPTSRQPKNASPLSVHPAGMAVDLRIPASGAALDWLEHELLSLEQAGVIDVTREHHPPHLHVAVFPEQYARYAAEHAPAVVPETQIKSSPIAPRVPSVLPAGDSTANPWAAFFGGSAGLLVLGLLAVGTPRRRTAGPSAS
jgi:uncharacterized protein DUF5715